MVQSNDEVYHKIKKWDKEYWRVARVVEWAEKDDKKNSL